LKLYFALMVIAFAALYYSTFNILSAKGGYQL